MEEEKQQIELPIEFRDKRNSDWYWISRLVYEEYASKIGVIGLALYNAYASYARDKAEAWPSLKTISEKLKVSIPTIVRYNKFLETYKLIEVKSGKEGGRSNIVYLLKVKGIKQVNTSSKPRLDPGIKQVNTNEKNNNEKHITIPKGIEKSPPSYGNEDINYLFQRFRELTGLQKIDGSQKQNRRYCWLCLKKFGDRQKIELLLKVAVKSDFHRVNLTSFKYLYYHGVKILAELKDQIENPRFISIGKKI